MSALDTLGWKVAPDLVPLLRRAPDDPKKTILLMMHRWEPLGFGVLPFIGFKCGKGFHVYTNMAQMRLGLRFLMPGRFYIGPDPALRSNPGQQISGYFLDLFKSGKMSTLLVFGVDQQENHVESVRSGIFHIAKEADAEIRFVAFDRQTCTVSLCPGSIKPSKEDTWETFGRETFGPAVVKAWNDAQPHHRYRWEWDPNVGTTGGLALPYTNCDRKTFDRQFQLVPFCSWAKGLTLILAIGLLFHIRKTKTEQDKKTLPFAESLICLFVVGFWTHSLTLVFGMLVICVVYGLLVFFATPETTEPAPENAQERADDAQSNDRVAVS